MNGRLYNPLPQFQEKQLCLYFKENHANQLFLVQWISSVIKSMASKNFFGKANWIWRITNPIMDCWNTHLIYWHSTTKSHHVIFIVLSAHAVNHGLIEAHSIGVQLRWITSAKRKFQILSDYAGICQIFPENSRFCHRHGKI